MPIGFTRAAAIAALVLVLANAAMAQQGTVHLTNGGRVHGEIMEVLPGEAVRLKLADGSVRTVPWAEVARVDDPTQAPPATVPPPANPAPPAPPADVAPTPQPPPAPGPPPAAPPQPYPAPPPASTPPPAAEAAVPTATPEAADEVARRSQQLTLALVGVVGLGGTLNGDIRLRLSTGESASQSAEADYSPEFGGAAHFDAPLHPNFSIGGFARVLSWRTVPADERALFIDFAVAPRARFPFGIGDGWGAVYLQLALGMAYVDLPTSDVSDTSPVFIDYTTTTDPAFLVGPSLGVQLMLSPIVGLVLEVGWHHHFFGQSLRAEVTNSLGVTEMLWSDSELDGGQVMLQTGLLVGF